MNVDIAKSRCCRYNWVALAFFGSETFQLEQEYKSRYFLGVIPVNSLKSWIKWLCEENER